MYNMINIWKTGELEVVFFKEEKTDIVSMAVLPAGVSEKIVAHREGIRESVAAKGICDALDFAFPANNLESMFQIKFTGDFGFAQHGAGVDMRNSATIGRFKLVSQEEKGNSFCSVFESEDKMKIVHTMTRPEGCRYLECKTEFINGSETSRRVEMFTSFSMGMISLLHNDDAPKSLKLHRYTTTWSSEAKHLEQSFEDLNMEISWQSAGVRCQRFGQRSSMVNKEYQPFAAVEDTKNGIIWAAAVEATSPWELMVSRYCDFVNISGGLPDREFAGWFKDVAPGETLTSPVALLTARYGNCNDAARDFLPFQKSEEPQQVLHPTFSEWCTTWGKPAEDRLLKIAPVAADLGVKYFQIDAGWFLQDEPGDWTLNKTYYPNGYKAFSEKLEKYGMKSGIWFEFENLYPRKKTLEETGKTNLVHTLDGFPLRSGGAYFLDFRKPEVIAHLTEKVVDFLRDNKVGYIKIDYNSAIPFGVDGESASPAENLQQHAACVRKFHEDLHRLVPGLRIEECSSGGHRLTPGWAKVGDYVSCTDAHEGVEIPILAAEALNFCYFDKALVWTTLRPTDDDNRLSYSMCAGMMGQMTLSGELGLLSAEQIAVVKKYLAFYEKITPSLRLNSKLRIDCNSVSRNYPDGRQVMTLESDDELLQIVHFFETDEQTAEFVLPAGDWELADCVKAESLEYSIDGSSVKFTKIAPFAAAAFRFRKK